MKFICAKPKKKHFREEKKNQVNFNTISFYMKILLNVSNCPILSVLVHYYNLHHFVFVQSKFIMMIKLLTAKINLGIYTSHVHVHDTDKIVLILISWISFQKYM